MCLVSIIIPAYNCAYTLPRCLDSCLNQTFLDYEVIVVNDGSSDKTCDVVNSYIAKDNRIRCVNKHNEGLVKARRSGVQQAKGTFVFFLDSDDYIEPNAIELLYAETYNYDIVIGDIVIENENGKPYPLQHANRPLFNLDNIGMYANYLSKSITASLCGRLIRKSIISDIYTPDDTTIGEDVITNILILKSKNARFHLVSMPLYHYVQYDSSMINTKKAMTLYKRLDYIKWVLDYFENSTTLISSDIIISSLESFVLTEYYAFLRDGGRPSMDKSLSMRIRSNYFHFLSFKIISIWQFLMIGLILYMSPLGYIYRLLFLYFRALINNNVK